MASYLIEFRFQSKRMRTYLKNVIYNINRKFGVGKRKHIPHITLVGPITTNSEKRLVADFARICAQTPVMEFKANGFKTFDNTRVVFVKIEASKILNEFRINLVNALQSYCDLQFQDKEKDRFRYHSTLAMNLNQNKFNSIRNYMKYKPVPNFTQIVMRITLLRNGKILREYDFLQRRLLNRWQALNKQITRRSKTLLKEFMQGMYDPNKKIGAQLEKTSDAPKALSLFKKIISFFRR